MCICMCFSLLLRKETNEMQRRFVFTMRGVAVEEELDLSKGKQVVGQTSFLFENLSIIIIIKAFF